MDEDEGRKVLVWAKDLRAVVSYTFFEEEADYLAADDDAKEHHVFRSILRLRECLED